MAGKEHTEGVSPQVFPDTSSSIDYSVVLNTAWREKLEHLEVALGESVNPYPLSGGRTAELVHQATRLRETPHIYKLLTTLVICRLPGITEPERAHGALFNRNATRILGILSLSTADILEDLKKHGTVDEIPFSNSLERARNKLFQLRNTEIGETLAYLNSTWREINKRT